MHREKKGSGDLEPNELGLLVSVLVIYLLIILIWFPLTKCS